VIVVDSNIIGYLYLSSARSEQAEQVLRQDSHWVAPLLWRSELESVLTLYLRRGHLSLTTARKIMDEALKLMAGQEYEVRPARVLELAAESGCSAYDCEFVALAEELGVRLVTVDQQILRQFPAIASSPESFLASRSG
jgi:predicted nucleic acid-binding protein